MQPVILALSQHAEIQKLLGASWVSASTCQPPFPSSAAGVFIVRGISCGHQLAWASRSSLSWLSAPPTSEVLLPFQLQYAARQTWVRYNGGCTCSPPEPLLGGYCSTSLSSRGRHRGKGWCKAARTGPFATARPCYHPRSRNRPATTKSPLHRPGAATSLKLVQFAVGVARKIYHPLPPLRSVKSPQKPCHNS